MKSILFYPALLLIAASLAFTACENDDEDENNNSIEADKAAELIGSTITNGGALDMADDVVQLDAANNPGVSYKSDRGCGEHIYDTIDFNYDGQIYQYSYNYIFDFVYNCTNGIPDNMSMNISSSVDFAGPNYEIDHSTNINWTITGVYPTSEPLIFNGDVNVDASSNNLTNNTERTYTLDLTYADVTYDRTNMVYTSGSVNIAISGSGPNGSFAYEGTITFNGSETATLTVDGSTFTLNLTNGTVS